MSAPSLSSGGQLEVSVNVKNTGARAGQEVVMLFTAAHFASITPDVRRLRAFNKINLEPGEQKTVTFTLDADDISFINAQNLRVTEAGSYDVMIGNLKDTFEFVYQ